MGGDCMTKEEYEYIVNIQNYMLEATNMTKSEAWNFAFRLSQFKDSPRFMKLLKGGGTDDSV
jgi:hypothetical protein